MLSATHIPFNHHLFLIFSSPQRSAFLAGDSAVGAPYYAGMAALRVGAELLYLCTAEEATGREKMPEISGFHRFSWPFRLNWRCTYQIFQAYVKAM